MPQAKRSTSTRSAGKFKEPAALKRLTTSLDSAQKALAELTKGSGRATGKASKDLYGDMRKFVSDARREGNKLGKALQREFDQAQKQLAKATKSTSTTRSSSARSTAKRATSGKRSTASRSTSSRASSGRSTTRRASSGSASTRRGTSRRTSKS